MTKLKNSYYDKTQNSNCDKPKQKVWQNSKTKIVTKLKNSNSDQTQKLKLWRFFGIKLKKSICDKIQKIKYWQNSKTQIATKKIKLWQNSKTQIVTVVIVAVVTAVLVTSFSKNNLTPSQPMRCSHCSFSQFSWHS